ncbi:MAG: hypothetical protein U9N87_01915, partial [Planctomycetota bacterium]|nr:hypothetical protein [Planctomycetota bacterium]
MKQIIPLVVVVVLFATGASPRSSGWMESFDKFKNYPYNSWPSDGSKTLPAPWEDTVSMYAQAGIGHGDTAGASGPGSNWSWGHAFRPTADMPHIGDALVARVFLPANINYESVMLALTTKKSPGTSGQFAGGAKAVVHIGGGADKGFAKMSFRTTDPSDKVLGSVSAAPHAFLPAGAWYDVRLILGEDRTIALEYKHVKMSGWIPVGALTVHDDFHPNYVAISTTRGGRVDDVG